MEAITSQEQYDAVKVQADAFYAKGSRLRTLENHNLFNDDLTSDERAEFEALLAEYTALGDAMKAYNAPAMNRVMSQLNSDE